MLGVSARHAWQLLAAYSSEGAAALPHGDRGRLPRNSVSTVEAAAVVNLANGPYPGANHIHLT